MQAAAGHASVRPRNDNRHAMGSEHAVEGIGNFDRHSLLDLKPLGMGLDKASQFRNAHNAMARQIADVRPARDRSHMVLTMGHEVNDAHRHHLVLSGDLLKSSLQQLLGS